MKNICKLVSLLGCFLMVASCGEQTPTTPTTAPSISTSIETPTIALTTNVINVSVGQSKKIVAEIKSSSSSYELDYMVTDTSIASVDAQGNVTGLKGGRTSFMVFIKNTDVAVYGSIVVEEAFIPVTKGEKGNKVLTPAFDLGSTGDFKTYRTSLADFEFPNKIEAVKIVLSIDFNGTDLNSQWYGGDLMVGSKSVQFTSANGYFTGVENPDYSYKTGTYTFITEVSNLTKSSEITLYMTHAGGPIKFALQEIKVFYTNDLTKISESVPVNQEIFSNSGSSEARVSLSSFTKRGAISKIDLELYSESPVSYTGGNIYVTGVVLPNTNNTVTIGGAITPNQNSTGTVSIYLEKYVEFNPELTLSFTSWYAPVNTLQLKSVTLWTNVEEIPSTPTNLVANPGNNSVTLEWSPVAGASSYLVYMDDALYTEVYENYCVVDNLVNGVQHTFKVAAKNGMGVSGFSTAVQGSGDANAKYDQFIDGVNSELETMIGKNNLVAALKKSVISTNSNARVKDVIAKMRSGADTTVAYIGGSITEGEGADLNIPNGTYKRGWAYYSYEYMANKFGTGNNVKYVNAAISGTGSEIGIVRSQKDLFDHNPDMIFIEFAVNNGYNDFYNETYESLIRLALNQPNKPAVILTFSWTMYSGEAVEKYMTQLGSYYNLPMISVHKGLNDLDRTLMNYNGNTSSYLCVDQLHPSDDGHKLYAKLVANSISIMNDANQDAAYVAPSKTYNGQSSGVYDTIKMIDHTDTEHVSLGSWSKYDTHYSSLYKSDVNAFSKGWTKQNTKANEAMTVNVNCKNFIIVYKADNPSLVKAGTLKVEYYKNGDSTNAKTLTQNLNSYGHNNGTQESGWTNPVAILLIDEDVSSNYTIKLSLSSASEVGTILAFGYSN